MASTFSDLKIQLMATGENSGTWGDVTNVNLGTAIEEAITGSANVAFSSADVTLPFINTNETQAARNLRLNLTGTSGGARNLIVPAIEKVYIINNGLAHTVTVKNAAGTGIAVPTGKTMYVYNNGTNVVDAITHLTSLTLGSALPVASGGTGVTTSTGTGNVVLSNSPTLVTPALGTPASGVLTNATGLPIVAGTTGTLSVARGGTGVTTSTGTGNVVLSTSPALAGVPTTPTAAAGTNTTQVASTAHVFAERTNTATLTNKTLTSPVVNTPNLTGGTINNATIGASTPSTVASTNLSYTGTLTGGTGVINIGSGQVVKDAAGNVGVGTSTPAAKLDVVGNSILRGNIQNFQNQFIGNSAGSSYLPDDGVFGGSIRNGGGFFITTGGTERLRITNTGNVGIGTSSPVRKLDVLGDVTVAGFYRNVDVDVLGVAGMQVELGARSGTTSTAGGSIGAQLNDATTGELQLYSRTGGALTEKVRIDSSGNVGIGTSSPTVKLEVARGSEGEYLRVGGDDAANARALRFTSSSSGGGAGSIHTINASSVAGILAFATASTERARIDANGNFLFGATSSLALGIPSLEVGGGNGNGIITVRRNTTTQAGHILFINPNGQVGSITTNGSATAFNTSSDYRLKEDTKPVLNPIDRLMQLKPINFAWKVDGSRTDGFLAHEAQAVVPDAVTGTKDAVDKDGKPQYQGIDQSKIVPLLTAALQDAIKRIEQLELQINSGV